MNTGSPRHADIDRRLAAVARDLQHKIDTYGWAIINVPVPVRLPGARSDSYLLFAYTVGLTEQHRPELCMTGIPQDVGMSVLNDLARRTTTGDEFTHGQELSDVIDGYDVTIIDGPTNGTLLQPTIALSRYRTRNVKLQQCVWPDPQGQFPWQDGYSMPHAQQPTIAMLT